MEEGGRKYCISEEKPPLSIIYTILVCEADRKNEGQEGRMWRPPSGASLVACQLCGLRLENMGGLLDNLIIMSNYSRTQALNLPRRAAKPHVAGHLIPGALRRRQKEEGLSLREEGGREEHGSGCL